MTSASLAHRGRAAGILLMLLGAWGALVPFVGPYFGFAYTPDKAWACTSGRLWLSVLPGAAAFLGGLFVVASDRIANAGALLAAAAGTWFVVGIPVTALALPASQHISESWWPSWRRGATASGWPARSTAPTSTARLISMQIRPDHVLFLR